MAYPPRAASPEQDNRAQIAYAFLRTRGWTNAEIAAAIGYKGANMLGQWQRKVNNLSGAKAEDLITLAKNVEHAAHPAPAPKYDTGGSRTAASGIFDALRDARGDLKRAHGRLLAVAEHALPLLRPGLVQLAQRIDTLSRDLEVS